MEFWRAVLVVWALWMMVTLFVLKIIFIINTRRFIAWQMNLPPRKRVALFVAEMVFILVVYLAIRLTSPLPPGS